MGVCAAEKQMFFYCGVTVDGMKYNCIKFQNYGLNTVLIIDSGYKVL
jgi:hypothetical protein